MTSDRHDSAAPEGPRPPRLLDQVRSAIRLRHYSRRTEAAYVSWVRRFILFHDKRHPAEMGDAEVTAFLSDLALRGRVSASTQNQAMSALLFLYREVLKQALPWMNRIVRAKRPVKLPVVLTRGEVKQVFSLLDGTPRLMAALELPPLREGSRRKAKVRTGLGKSDRPGSQGGLRKRDV